MTLVGGAEHLQKSLLRLEEVIAFMALTVSEDRPASEAPALVDRFENRIVEMVGCTQECMEATERLSRASDPSRAVRELSQIHKLVQDMSSDYQQHLCTYDGIHALLRMGTELGRAWEGWSRAAKSAIERCAPHLDETQRALGTCWMEIAAQSSPRSRRGFAERASRLQARQGPRTLKE